MSLRGNTEKHEAEVYSKMLSTVSAIAGNSRLGMTIQEALDLTEKTLAKRKNKRQAVRAARKRNRGK